jgi:hypothetical protein
MPNHQQADRAESGPSPASRRQWGQLALVGPVAPPYGGRRSDLPYVLSGFDETRPMRLPVPAPGERIPFRAWARLQEWTQQEGDCSP